jgi:hypothetical protein
MSGFDSLDGCIITLADPTGQIERECAEPALTQKSVALTYALAMHAESHGVPVDWPRANAAIRSRWPKGLARVKEMAWKHIRAKATPFTSEGRKP